MNDSDASAAADLKKQVADLARAVKTGFFALLLVASYFNIRAIFILGKSARIFDAMLGGRDLPWNTVFAISERQWLMALGCALPAIGITALFAKSAKRSILTINALLVLAIIEYYFTWNALFAPMTKIIQLLSSGPGSQ